MKIRVKAQDLLQDALPDGKLFADWLRGALHADFLLPEHRDAGRELDRALGLQDSGDAPPSGPAPLFASGWVAAWSEAMAADLPDEADRAAFRSQLAALQAGTASVVVTGQQPGFLGGPLYTLYKVATTVAVARRRTASGRPTVPVFWSGDDDDDLPEALSAVGWGPGGAGLLRSPALSAQGAATGRAPLLGRLADDPWNAAAASWLASLAGPGSGAGQSLGADLADIWQEAVTDHHTWARLARRALLRVFAGCGLIVVSGDDPGLHLAAQPLYAKMGSRLRALSALTENRGRELAAAGWHAQIGPRSLARPLFTVEGDRRVPLTPGAPLPPSSLLRPGVMLRSPVQDWLLRPAAVVAGPGELAYLRQLDPLYADLGIARPPLVPRLFAWLLPPKVGADRLRAFRERPLGDPALAGRLADEAEEQARRLLADLLTRESVVPPQRAESLARGRARRWRKGVAAMLLREIRRSAPGGCSDAPAWVFPDGRRQERHLAYAAAAALWGDDLTGACLEAAAQHLEAGLERGWREFVLQVPDPEERKDAPGHEQP